MIIIAEFCQNHNGDFEILKDMIHLAHENGADYAKIQTIFADMVSFRERFENGIKKNGKIASIKRPYKDEYDRLKKLEISYEKQREFIEICKKVGIKPLTTAFTRDSVNKIKEIGFKDIKIASYDCASTPLIADVKKIFNKIFVSTGATYDNEIENTANILKGSNFSLLHCVTMYPTPLNEFNLSRMLYLKKLSKLVGWSDHSLTRNDGILGTKAAIYYGANIIERHFTILPQKATKDGPVSINPNQLYELKKFSKFSKKEQYEDLINSFPLYEQTYGKQKRALSDIEILNRDYFRGRFCNKDSNGNQYYNWE